MILSRPTIFALGILDDGTVNTENFDPLTGSCSYNVISVERNDEPAAGGQITGRLSGVKAGYTMITTGSR
jgi:hypothetical protein